MAEVFRHGLGDKVKDKVSGLVGIVTSRAEHLYGCARYWVQPQEVKDGKIVEGTWIDEDSLELQESAVIHRMQYRVVDAEPIVERAPMRLAGGPTSQPSSQARQTTK